MNNRANILYFVEHLCDMAKRESHVNFVRMVQRDILKIVDSVAPDDGSGAANVKVIRKVCLLQLGPFFYNTITPNTQVLASFQQKAVLEPDTVAELEACLKDRETHLEQSVLEPLDQTLTGPTNGNPSQLGDTSQGNATGKATVRPDKRQIEQRIEEDRERHKRFREGIWMVNKNADDDEFQRMWDECSDFGEEDFIAAQEESQERRMPLDLQIEELKKKAQVQKGK